MFELLCVLFGAGLLLNYLCKGTPLSRSIVYCIKSLMKPRSEAIQLPSRVPSSIALLITGEEHVDIKSLCSFVSECQSMGIVKIVVYDVRGRAALAGTTLQEALGDRVSVEVAVHLRRKESGDSAASASKVRVLLLRAEHGQQLMADVCDEMSRTLSSRSTPIKAADINEHLRESLLDDIALTVVVGGTPSICGFPPWPLRITEFVERSSIPSTREDVLDSLKTFASRDIRVGR